MIRLRIESESILSHFVWDAKLRFLFGFSKSREELSGRCPLRKMTTTYRTGLRPSVVTMCQVWGMIRWQLPTLIICVGFRWRDVLDPGMMFSEVDWLTICQGLGMSWWQLATMMKCIGFQSRDVLDLEMLSCWQLATLIICVGFRRRDVLDIKSSVFGGWLGDCQFFIFSNTIKTWCFNNLSG